MRKFIFLIVSFFIISLTYSQTNFGYYPTLEAYKSGAMVTGYKFVGGSVSKVTFSFEKKTTFIETDKLFAIMSDKGKFLRVLPEVGALELYIEGKICLFGSFMSKNQGQTGDYPEYFTPYGERDQFYFSDSRSGELKKATKKSIKALLVNDPEILKIYEEKGIVEQVIVLYNKKHM